MTLYFCRAPNIVLASHSDEQIYINPIAIYGAQTYIVCDYGGPAARMDAATNQFIYPDPITSKMQADSVKLECRRRITLKVSDQAQRNITTHVTDLQTKVIQTPPLTPEEQSDIDTAALIWEWIGAAARPASSMLGTSDALIAANDLEWWQDVKWPPWNSSWDAFVARF